ncbi:MAG: hypothetical protein ACTS73_04010 [Arsenophonus sp. NEOnobi-MAG3]
MNSFTLQESEKRTGIDLKTAVKLRYYLLSSAAITQLNALSGVVEVNEIFFYDFLNFAKY